MGPQITANADTTGAVHQSTLSSYSHIQTVGIVPDPQMIDLSILILQCQGTQGHPTILAKMHRYSRVEYGKIRPTASVHFACVCGPSIMQQSYATVHVHLTLMRRSAPRSPCHAIFYRSSVPSKCCASTHPVQSIARSMLSTVHS